MRIPHFHGCAHSGNLNGNKAYKNRYPCRVNYVYLWKNAHSNAQHWNVPRLNLKFIYLFLFFRKSKYALYVLGWVIGLSKPFAINVSLSSLCLFLLILFQFLSNFRWIRIEKNTHPSLKPILVAETEMNTQNPFKAVASILTYSMHT